MEGKVLAWWCSTLNLLPVVPISRLSVSSSPSCYTFRLAHSWWPGKQPSRALGPYPYLGDTGAPGAWLQTSLALATVAI